MPVIRTIIFDYRENTAEPLLLWTLNDDGSLSVVEPISDEGN